MKMKSGNTLRWLLTAALAAAGAVQADPILGSGSSQAFPGVLNESGSPFFDTLSYDGPNTGVAYYLRGTGSPYGSSPNITPVWYGDTSVLPTLDFYFNSAHLGYEAVMKVEMSDWAGVNEFGWYDVTAPATLHTIFAGSDAAGTAVQFIPSATYGYYLKPKFGATYYTQSSLNPLSEAAHQHFAIFREDPGAEHERLWIGLEDLPLTWTGTEGAGDYNDMILTVVGAPEPSPAVMTGLGLLALGLGLGWIRARRCHSSD